MPAWVPSGSLIKRLSTAQSVTVLTGAGASAESGIPTFRGRGGLWRDFRAEDLATRDAFERNPMLVWEWYMWRRDIIRKAAPNLGHLTLAALESKFSDFTLITQNVDGLHQRAGSKNVVEIHGNIMRNRCFACAAPLGDTSLDTAGQPAACGCGGLARPDVVWFGELLSSQALKLAWDAAGRADVYLAIGTSSVVQPAAGLTDIARRAGAFTVEINPERTEMSSQFDETIRLPAGMALPFLLDALSLNIWSVATVGTKETLRATC